MRVCRCEPSGGVLEAGQATSVRVIFTPAPFRDAPYQQVQ